jgi:7-cyano-7-deazaguanine synthase
MTIAVPDGHYADETMKATVVPNRNMLMLAAAAAISIANGGRTITYAAHAGDHAIYPDCRPEWLGHIARSISASTEGTVRVETPFLEWNKTEICKLGLLIKVPYHLTYTCYKGNQKSCGKCGSCTERLEAFKTNKVSDPLTYEA